MLRVHGSLLWSLGKIITTPEVPRVYVSSFWKEKNIHCENLDLLQREEKDLIEELKQLPSTNLIRKINLVARRCRQVRVHALIISYLKEHSSAFCFRPEAQQHEMIDHLENIFKEILRLHPELVSLADFPDISHFQKQLLNADWSTFHTLKHHEELLAHVNELLTTDLSNLIHEVRYNGQETSHNESKETTQKSTEVTPQTHVPPNNNSHNPPENQQITTPAKRRGKFHGRVFN